MPESAGAKIRSIAALLEPEHHDEWQAPTPVTSSVESMAMPRQQDEPRWTLSGRHSSRGRGIAPSPWQGHALYTFEGHYAA